MYTTASVCVGGLAGGVYGWVHAEHAGGRSVGGVGGWRCVLVVCRGVWRCGGCLPAGGRVAGRVVVRGPVRAVAAKKRRWQTRKKGGPLGGPPLFVVGVGGGVLLSHTLAGAVPSALAVLASGFGKEGPGVSLPL